MADAPLPVGSAAPASQTRHAKATSTLARVARYTLIRVVALFLTVVVGVYVTVLIANMGGYVDEIRRGVIREGVSLSLAQDPEFRQLPPDVRRRQIEEIVRLEEERLGLDRPFLLRSFSYLSSALTLDLGRAEFLQSDSGSRQVRLIILERLPPTLYLFATANLILFFLSLFAGLYLSRRYGSFLDKAIIALAPTSAAPSWFYGIFLILIFAALWGVLPFGGMVATPPPREPFDYALSLLRHLILPVTAFVISAIFLTIYSWRTFFLIYSSEDYVEMAKAKGLPDRTIERRYVLRPTLPYIITSFALTLIALWQGAIVLETVFNWPGLGRLLYQAIVAFDIPVIVGATVIYAYLLALTVFLLDIIYALLDPRVKIGGGSSA
jgi:peptide/nickel transport system permease protein